MDYLFCLHGKPALLGRVRDGLESRGPVIPCPPMTDSRWWMVSRVPQPGDRIWVVWIGARARTGIGSKGELLGAGVLERSPSADEDLSVLWSKGDCAAHGVATSDDLGATFLRLARFIPPAVDSSTIEASQYQAGFNTPTTLDHERLSRLLPLP